MHQALLKKRAIIFTAVGLVLAIAGIMGLAFTTFAGIHISKVGFTTDGYDSPPRKVSGLLLMPDRPVSKPTPAVIFSHGFTGSKEMYFAPARELARRGVIVLAIDLRGHGSTGGTSDFGYSETRDVWAAADYLSTLKDVDRNKIAATGHSLGGTTSTRAGIFQKDKLIKTVAAVFSWSGGAAPNDALYGPTGDFIGRLWPSLTISRRYDINSAAARHRRDVLPYVTKRRPPNYLLVIGSSDEFISVAEEKKIISAATGIKDIHAGQIYGDFKQGTARELVVTKGTHLQEIADPKVWDAVGSWIFRSFGLEKPSPVGKDPSYRFLFQGLLLIGFALSAVGGSYTLRLLFHEKAEAWQQDVSAGRTRDYRILAAVSIIVYIGASFATLPLTRAIGIRAFIPFGGLPMFLGPDLLGVLSAGHVIFIIPIMAALFFIGRRWGLDPFSRETGKQATQVNTSTGEGRPLSERADSSARMSIYSRLALAVVPFAVFVTLYSISAYLLHVPRGVPISIPGFFIFFGVMAVYFYLEGHFFHAFLLPSWGELNTTGGIISYVVSEAAVRGLGFSAAFLAVTSNPLLGVRLIGTTAKFPLVPAMLVVGFLMFLPISALTLFLRRRGYGVLTSSIMLALIVPWIFSTQIAVRFF